MGVGCQAHEVLCPKHLASRGKTETELVSLQYIRGHNSNLFLSQLELLPGFPAEMPYAVLSA